MSAETGSTNNAASPRFVAGPANDTSDATTRDLRADLLIQTAPPGRPIPPIITISRGNAMEVIGSAYRLGSRVR